MLRSDPILSTAFIVLMIESNLAFESDHMASHMNRSGLRNIVFMRECSNVARVGIQTTATSKDQQVLIFLETVATEALTFYDKLHTNEDDAPAMRERLFRELENYAIVVNPSTGKKKYTGKVGQEQDDLSMAIQMCLLHTRIFKTDVNKYGKFHRHPLGP